jgi:hypothetical protein
MAKKKTVWNAVKGDEQFTPGTKIYVALNGIARHARINAKNRVITDDSYEHLITDFVCWCEEEVLGVPMN